MITLQHDTNAACYSELFGAKFAEVKVTRKGARTLDAMLAAGQDEDGRQVVVLDAVDIDANPISYVRVMASKCLASDWAAETLTPRVRHTHLIALGFVLQR